MTPFYLRCVEAASKSKDARFNALAGVMKEARVFNIADCMPLIRDLQSSISEKWIRPEASEHLPYPVIFIETKTDEKRDWWHLLVRTDCGFDCHHGFQMYGVDHNPRRASSMSLKAGINGMDEYAIDNARDEKLAMRDAAYWVSVVAVINSPRIIEAEQIKPSFTVARKLKALGVRQSAPASKIILKVYRSKQDGGDGEAMTGQRALHMCRQHLRICASGTLTWVREHWRGDAANGVLPSRPYDVKP